jgi:hypothetical protein
MNEPSPASPNGRHVNGRFAPGNQAAVGNPGNTRMKELRRALLECATEEKVKAVEESLHELAVGGDVAAAKVWLDHVVGKPVQAVKLSGPDGAALDLPAIVATIMVALGDEPAARVKVAAAFRKLGSSADGDAVGGGPGPGD